MQQPLQNVKCNRLTTSISQQSDRNFHVTFNLLKYGLMFIGGITIFMFLMKIILLIPLKIIIGFVKMSILNGALMTGLLYQYMISDNLWETNAVGNDTESFDNGTMS